jgi:crotonobetainyl-CoA:carnitine CoA-transferase CaiB-like acyl-CoA transferase
MNEPGTVRGPLSGLLVVEMGQLIAGPFCGQLLGDMGAEVVKIETPGAGDPMREWGRGAKPLWWEVIARNKKSVTINLRTEAGQALSRRLIAKSDIVIENFRPGTLEKWGMGPSVLHADNPRLIITRMSGYGQTGPYARRAGYGLIGEAMGGWRHIVGEPDRPPSRMGVSIGDSLCATYGCMGALAALRHRDMTGEGQVIDASLYESVLQVMESLIVDYSVAGYVRERTGAILPGISPSNVYRCKDGDYLIGANQDSVFERLCMAMGQPELATADAYSSHESRGKNQAKLDDHITQWTSVRSVEEVEGAMIAHGIPAGRVYRAPDMISDPQFRARQSIVDLEHPVYGSIKMQNAFPFFSRTPGSVRRLAPATPGQDNHQVFGEILGLGEGELKQLERDGTI